MRAHPGFPQIRAIFAANPLYHSDGKQLETSLYLAYNLVEPFH